MECAICGISDSRRQLFRVVSPTGIILACEKCIGETGYPKVKNPEIKPGQEEKRDSVYETMVRLTGVKLKDTRVPRPVTEESQIKQLINKKYEEKIKSEPINMKPRPDLVDKFHWVIMRVRRVKGLTQKQLAERIGEPENAVKMAEQGVIPSGYELIEKLERFLGVKLVRDRSNQGNAVYLSPTNPIINRDPDFYPESYHVNPKEDNEKPVTLKQPSVSFTSTSMPLHPHPSVPAKTPSPNPLPSAPSQAKTMASKRISFDKKTLDSLTIDNLRG